MHSDTAEWKDMELNTMSQEGTGCGLEHQFTGDSQMTDDSFERQWSGASYAMPEDEMESPVGDERQNADTIQEIENQLQLTTFGDAEQCSKSSLALRNAAGEQSIWKKEHDTDNCTVTTLVHIRDLLLKKLARLKEVLHIDPDDAIPLLLQFAFDDDKVLLKWSEGNIENVTVDRHHTQKCESDIVECPVTLEDMKVEECDALPCGHYVSNEIWRGYLELAIKNGPGCISVKCPVDGCDERIRRSVIVRHCNFDDVKKFDWYLMDALLYTAPYIKYCPNPRCSWIVVGHEAEKRSTVVCHCGHVYCFSCLNDVHIPVPCEYAKDWLATFIEDYTPAWLEDNTKACPGCWTLIEKNQGCDHMHCDRNAGGCGTDFSWSQASSTRPSNNLPRTSRQYKDHMEYANRFVEENRKERLLRVDIEKAEAISKELIERAGLQLSEVSVLIEALNLLTRGTRIMKWSYVYDFYNKTDGGGELIQYWRNYTDADIRDLQSKATIEPEKKFLKQKNGDIEQVRKHLSDLSKAVKKAGDSLWRMVDGIEEHAALNH